MGLPRAIQAHKEGQLKQAAVHYQRAIDQKQWKPDLFQNYGALLRSNGELAKSKAIYLQGLAIYPKHLGILRNYANLLRESGHSSEALRISLEVLQIAWINCDEVLEKLYCECVDLLCQLGYLHWALALIRQAFAELGVRSSLLWGLFKISSHESVAILGLESSTLILELTEQVLKDCSPLERAEFLFSRAFFHANRDELSDAVRAIREAHRILETASLSDIQQQKNAQKLMNINSWNVSCVLLKVPDFELGWNLFEYRLQAPAVGPQRWQRHLKKLFTHRELPLWRGESLKSQRLLLLEEQAIGDSMMFLTLLPTLVAEAAHVGVVLCTRLLPIYRRSFYQWIEAGKVSIWSHGDLATDKLTPEAFDFQSPVGSVCRYRFTEIEQFAPSFPILVADSPRVLAYRNSVDVSAEHTLRVGISWRGGGRSDRIKLKSIDAEMFADLMCGYPSGVSFVDLQYGDVSSVINKWQSKGLPVIHENNVNPLKNMEEWLNLVASCDAVVSVANTTIHGAGGLNIPTMCLLSLRSDWRWLKDSEVKRSYWYPSVGIARESKRDGWKPALKNVRQWIIEGCPMPTGRVKPDLRK